MPNFMGLTEPKFHRTFLRSLQERSSYPVLSSSGLGVLRFKGVGIHGTHSEKP